MLKLFELINLNDLRQSVSSNGLSWTNSSGFTANLREKRLNMLFWWPKMSFKGYNYWPQGDF